jgi:hypothetical protein
MVRDTESDHSRFGNPPPESPSARVGITYESNGAPYNASWNNGVDSFIQKQSYGAKWLWSPNNLSQSVAASR